MALPQPSFSPTGWALTGTQNAPSPSLAAQPRGTSLHTTSEPVHLAQQCLTLLPDRQKREVLPAFLMALSQPNETGTCRSYLLVFLHMGSPAQSHTLPPLHNSQVVLLQSQMTALPTLLAQQRCLCCRAGRGQPHLQQSQQTLLLCSQRSG